MASCRSSPGNRGHGGKDVVHFLKELGTVLVPRPRDLDGDVGNGAAGLPGGGVAFPLDGPAKLSTMNAIRITRMNMEAWYWPAWRQSRYGHRAIAWSFVGVRAGRSRLAITRRPVRSSAISARRPV